MPKQAPVASKPIVVDKFLGLYTKVEAAHVPLGGLVRADNIDFDDPSNLVARSGYTTRIAGNFTDGYCTRDQQRAYVADGNAIYRLNPDLTTTWLAALSSSAPIHWTEVNLATYAVNGTDFIVLEPNGARAWGLPVPAKPLVTATDGPLPAGRYQVALTYSDGYGRESGALDAVSCILSSPGGLFISGIQNITGLTTNCYISSTNSGRDEKAPTEEGQLKFAFQTDQTTQAWRGPLGSLVIPLTTQFLQPPWASAGTIPAYWNDRLWLAEFFPERGYSILWNSQDQGFDWFNFSEDGLPIHGEVVLLAGCMIGLVIGTKQELFLWNDEQLVRLATYGTTPGHHHFLDEDGALWFWSTRGVCVSGQAGPQGVSKFTNLTDGNNSLPPGVRGTGMVIHQSGFKRYVVVVEDGGTADNPSWQVLYANASLPFGGFSATASAS
jgi:hypothetical protein